MIRKIVLRDHTNSEWLLFESPAHVFTTDRVADVLPILMEIERQAKAKRLYAAGYLSYEAAAGFDKCLATRSPARLPLLYFGLFGEPERLSRLPDPTTPARSPLQWSMSTSQPGYLDNIQKIKHQIALGNSYQINFTVRQHTDKLFDPWTFFLHTAGDAPYSAFLDFEAFSIVSASPELLFRLDGEDLLCRPMKGTAERGMTASDDCDQRRKLHNSTKDRAENVMVTDMLRSDMGRVATPGTVKVTSLFDIEKYPTVWQMTSSVTARTTASIIEILRALFPCASVTGAPKASSMAIIAELEDSPREIYTGTIGYYSPGRVAQFNVAIRTAWVNHESHRATYGTGGGIVWDSVAEDEFRECLAKTKVLGRSLEDNEFELLETMRWSAKDGYFLLEQHLNRLRDSADYFDFRLDRAGMETALAALGNRARPDECRVRLLVRRDSTFRLTSTTLASDPPARPRQIKLAAMPISITDPFLYHKTTRRSAYTRARKSVSNCDDVLLWNPDGYVTETTIANVVVRVGEELLTPPTGCGLLAGTYRQQLLQQGIIRESKIHRDDLSINQQVLLVNSVRGWFEGRLRDD